MSRKKMWLGTQHHAQWVNPPLSGADMSPSGWGAEGVYLSGGSFVRQSQDSHRQYIFEWSGASSREAAEYLQALRDGVFNRTSRDLIYFIDPLIEDRNILPTRWAQPGIATQENGPVTSALGTVTPKDSTLPGLPLVGAHVVSQTLAAFSARTSPARGSVWIPAPEGKAVSIFTWEEATGDSGLYVRAQNLNGSWAAARKVSGSTTIPGARGVLLGTVGSFDFFGARARVGAFSTPPQWMPGQGHSGCRFIGNPTWIANSGVNGGQIGYAATLREVGDWL